MESGKTRKENQEEEEEVGETKEDEARRGYKVGNEGDIEEEKKEK